LVMDHHSLPLKIIHNAEEAIEYLQSNNPDVVVIDLFLPGLDGYRAFEKIRKNDLAREAKIVATTAYYTNDTQQEVLSRGFDGYISKPFVATDLVPYLAGLAR
jgi:CheY-like chemotaxis protein